MFYHFFLSRIREISRSVFRHPMPWCILLLLFFATGNAAPGGVEKTDIQQLQKDLADLERTFDNMETSYWHSYFCSKNSQEYKSLNTALMSLTNQARLLKNRMLKLQQNGVIPRYIKLSQDYAVEAVVPRIRVLLNQHRLYDKWDLKHTPLSSSRSALNFQHTAHAGDLLENFGLSLEDEKYLLAVNHQLNTNLKYLFKRKGDHNLDHDCRTHLHGKKIDMLIRTLGQDTAEFYDAVFKMRQYLLRTEILFQAVAVGVVFRPTNSAPPYDFQTDITRHLLRAVKLYNYVTDDFWCGFFFPDESCKYRATRMNMLGLRDELRYLKNLPQNRQKMKKLNSSGLNMAASLQKKMRELQLEESVVEMLALLRNNRKITYIPDWRTVGQAYITANDLQHSSFSPQSSRSPKRPMGYTTAEEEKHRLEIYQRTLREIRTGLLELSAIFLRIPSKKSPGTGGARSSSTSGVRSSGNPPQSAPVSPQRGPAVPPVSGKRTNAAGAGSTLVLELGLDTEIRFELRNGKLYADRRNSFGGVGTHQELKSNYPHVYFGRPACLAENLLWELRSPLSLPGDPVRITRVELLDSGRNVSVGSRNGACWIIWNNTTVTIADQESSSSLYKIKIHFSGN